MNLYPNRGIPSWKPSALPCRTISNRTTYDGQSIKGRKNLYSIIQKKHKCWYFYLRVFGGIFYAKNPRVAKKLLVHNFAKKLVQVEFGRSFFIDIDIDTGYIRLNGAFFTKKEIFFGIHGNCACGLSSRTGYKKLSENLVKTKMIDQIISCYRKYAP